MEKTFSDLTFSVLPDGRVRFVYSDILAKFLNIGDCEVKRVSTVDPEFADSRVVWYANIFDGTRLGPFDSREDAISAEVCYLIDTADIRK